MDMTENEYLEYLQASYENGNFEQCKRLFKELNKEGQKALLLNMRHEASRVFDFYIALM